MGLHTGIGRLVPALALGAGDDADRLLFRFEDRPLLDMRLEIGFGRPIADSLALVAYALPLLAEALALDVRAAVNEIGRAQVRTPITNEQLVCCIMIEKKQQHPDTDSQTRLHTQQ